MKALFILNDPPYGTEHICNGLRLAQAVPKRKPQTEVAVFLMAAAAAAAAVAAKASRTTPNGYYNIERMFKRVLAANGRVPVCGTCMDVRGLADSAVLAGARRRTKAERAAATIDAEKVILS